MPDAGVTPGGEIYDFARTVENETEFYGGTFSPDGHTFFVNQQGDRGAPSPGPGSRPGPTQSGGRSREVTSFIIARASFA
jgi:secreted PhoX family phosphatase